MSKYVNDQFQKILKDYKLTNADRLLDDAHCKVLYADLDEDIGGCTVTSNRCNTVVVNDNWDESYQTFVKMHEFSHVKLHPGMSTPFYRSLSMDSYVSKAEREANQMALKLLNHFNEDELANLTTFEKLDYLGLPYELERFLY